LATDEKSLKIIHAKMDGFSTAIKKQLSFNKMLETQLVQQAVIVSAAMENVNAMTMRGGKITCDPTHPNHDSRKKANTMAEEPPRDDDTEKAHEKPTTDEQFNRFMEMIQQVNINVSLMDAIQVPTYARYLKDIINNKRPLPTTEVVKLTEACSATILQQLSEKKKESGCPTIIC